MKLENPTIRLMSGLAIGYTKALAITSEDITLRSGTHFLLARNGRGKSTLLRTVAGSLRSLEGNFEREGEMQYLPEDLRFDAELTPKTIMKSLLPRRNLNAAIQLSKDIELDLSKPYGKLSTGNRRKTALILAEYSIREDTGNILLLDEPFSGLDAFARETFEQMWDASEHNVLRLVSCHPDYDSMVMPSVLMIEGDHIRHYESPDQKWSRLKVLLN